MRKTYKTKEPKTQKYNKVRDSLKKWRKTARKINDVNTE